VNSVGVSRNGIGIETPQQGSTSHDESMTTYENDKNELVDKLSKATSITENTCFDATQFPQLYNELKRHWREAMMMMIMSGDEDDGNDNPYHDEWFDRLYRQHNEAGRFYHTAVHLKEILEYLELLPLEQPTNLDVPTAKRTELRFATFFHDAVYNPQSSRNEQDSAKLFQEFCKQAKIIPESTKNTVVRLILATEKHQVLLANDDGNDNMNDKSLQQLFLDLDMAVLGKQHEAYLAYTALIRQEYAFVPREVYCEKRAAILESFLQRRRIYLSEMLFYEAFEATARRNLQAEIDLLKQGVVPGE
jgi:predicted metal-dependent HD superfamily phosphohydrolase